MVNGVSAVAVTEYSTIDKYHRHCDGSEDNSACMGKNKKEGRG